MKFIADLLGTFSNTFKIGKSKATLDASGLTAARTLVLQDKAGTIALTSDVEAATASASLGRQYANSRGHALP
jgi:hypothetical protein